jgi:hypothetical protein
MGNTIYSWVGLRGIHELSGVVHKKAQEKPRMGYGSSGGLKWA